MPFAEELAAAKGRATPETPAAPADAKAPPEPQGVLEPTDPFAGAEIELPTGGKPEVPADVKPEALPEAKAEAEAKKPIKIGKQEFDTIEDAVEYAKSLEAAALQDKAYIEGLKDAQAKVEAEKPQAKAKTLKERVSEKLFENPEAAVEDLVDSIKTEIREEYNKSLREAEQAKRADAAKKQAWESFYQEHPDLSSPQQREYLEEYLLPKLLKNGTLKPEGTREDFAREARKAMLVSKQESMPTKELPASPMVDAPPTAGATPDATRVKSEEKVDMVTAMNRMRRRTQN